LEKGDKRKAPALNEFAGENDVAPYFTTFRELFSRKFRLIRPGVLLVMKQANKF
jgi:hypothetical protein